MFPNSFLSNKCLKLKFIMCLIYCWHKIDKPINIHQQIDKTQSHQLIDDYGYHQLWLFHIIPLDFPISSTVVCCTTKQSGVLRLLGHGAAQTAFAALLKGSVTRIFVAAIAICKNFDVFHSCCRVHRSVVHRRQKKQKNDRLDQHESLTYELTQPLLIQPAENPTSSPQVARCSLPGCWEWLKLFFTAGCQLSTNVNTV